MKTAIIYISLALTLISCSESKIGVSEKQFPPISLVNHYEYYSGEHKHNQLGTAFLLKYRNDTFAITAKHMLAFLKPDSIKKLTLDNFISKWTMSPLNKRNEVVVIDKLLNEDKNEELKSKEKFKTDWLIFSIKENNANVQPLEFRETPLNKGEKCYAIGWTRHMKEGDQRVYEFKYYKSKGTHHIMKHKLIPDKFGGLSGAPVVDTDGKLVGIVSGHEFIVLAMQKMFSPVGTTGLKAFLDKL